MERARTFVQPLACLPMWSGDGFAQDTLPTFDPKFTKTMHNNRLQKQFAQETLSQCAIFRATVHDSGQPLW